MNNIPFNYKLDKVTERELVYDIVERLSLGKDLKDGSTLFYKAGTMVTDVIKKIIFMLPPSIVIHYSDLKVGVIHIAPGQKSGSCTINGLSNGEIALAYSQQTQMDIKECITKSGGTNLTCTYTTKVPFEREEYVKVYAY